MFAKVLYSDGVPTHYRNLRGPIRPVSELVDMIPTMQEILIMPSPYRNFFKHFENLASKWTCDLYVCTTTPTIDLEQLCGIIGLRHVYELADSTDDWTECLDIAKQFCNLPIQEMHYQFFLTTPLRYFKTMFGGVGNKTSRTRPMFTGVQSQGPIDGQFCVFSMVDLCITVLQQVNCYGDIVCYQVYKFLKHCARSETGLKLAVFMMRRVLGNLCFFDDMLVSVHRYMATFRAVTWNESIFVVRISDMEQPLRYCPIKARLLTFQVISFPKKSAIILGVDDRDKFWCEGLHIPENGLTIVRQLESYMRAKSGVAHPLPCSQLMNHIYGSESQVQSRNDSFTRIRINEDHGLTKVHEYTDKSMPPGTVILYPMFLKHTYLGLTLDVKSRISEDPMNFINKNVTVAVMFNERVRTMCKLLVTGCLGDFDGNFYTENSLILYNSKKEYIFNGEKVTELDIKPDNRSMAEYSKVPSLFFDRHICDVWKAMQC